jgi:hypothetical protein
MIPMSFLGAIAPYSTLGYTKGNSTPASAAVFTKTDSLLPCFFVLLCLLSNPSQPRATFSFE